MTRVRDQLAEMGFFGGVIDTGRRDGVMSEVSDSPASKERVDAARKRWSEIREKDLDRTPGRRYWVDRASGSLYLEPGGDPLLADGRGEVDLFAVVDGRIVFLQKPGGGPATLAELEAGEEAEEARQAAEEQQQRKFAASQPRVAVLREPPVSLRATIQLFEEAGGRVELGPDGRLQLTAPERLSGANSFAAWAESDLRRELVAHAETIAFCKDVVVAALQARNAKTPLVDAIPPGQVTITGGVSP